MKNNNKIGTWIRWIILIPVAMITLFLSGTGLVGFGFGAGPFMIAYLCSFPVFLLNFWSARIAAWGMWMLLLAAYLPMTIYNWPTLNPFQLLDSKGNGLLTLAIVLTQLASLAPKLNGDSIPRSADLL
jgi:hypothetical protein